MHTPHRFVRVGSGLFIGTLIGFLSSAAMASTVCGSTNAGWNVPNGATVYEIAPGVVGDLLSQLGEQRSHSMLSHGPGWWVTHSTSIMPPNVADCDNPVSKSFMAASTPGLSTIDQGAAFTFLYSNGPQPTALYYQRGTVLSGPGGDVDTGAAVGNLYLGSPAAFYDMNWLPRGSGSNTVWSMSFGSTSGPQLPIYYGWSQYMNVGSTAQGFPPAQTGQTAQGTGVVCSTSLAMWQHDALANTFTYTGDVVPRSYSVAQTQAAAHALWNDIYNMCSGVSNIANGGEFTVSVWSGLACLGISVCSNAANQVVNAFADDGFVNDQAGEWQNIVANNGATSISPDDVACWNGNGTGAPCSGSGSSFWGWDGNNLVQWNNAGSSYGCWQQ